MWFFCVRSVTTLVRNKILNNVLNKSSAMTQLLETNLTFGADVLHLLHDIEPNNGFLNNEYNLPPTDLRQHLSSLIDHANGINLPEGWVSYTTYWLFVNKKPVGISRLRHTLNDYLKELGGHIGYAIGKSERKKGYGSEILRLTIEKAYEMDINNLLLTCSITNAGSQRVIEKNNGILFDSKNGLNYYRITK